MQQKAPVNWLNMMFLTLTPLGALTLVPAYQYLVGFTAAEWGVFAFYMAATGMSITGGYHRLWSHKTYKAHFLVRLFFAIWGATACQNSILNWASDHRSHHRFVDDFDKDPYSAKRGFWYSHMGWVLRNHPRHVQNFENVKDLQRDPIVAWQHRNYLAIAVFMNGVVPYVVGLAIGSPLGTIILAFFLRVTLNHHFTFFINSLAHIWGRRPYSDASSARDNDVLAFLTYGEGYHNFHHTFQHDFRNGVRWWQFDPSKWFISMGERLGITSDLKIATKEQIEKAKLKMQLQLALKRMEQDSEAAKFRAVLEESYKQFVTTLNEWGRVKREWYQVRKASMLERMDRIELNNKYLELHYAIKLRRRQWKLLMVNLTVN